MRLLVPFLIASNFRRFLCEQATSNLTVKEALSHYEGIFKKENVSEARISIEFIMANVLNSKQITYVYNNENKALTEDELKKLHVLSECRIARMPIQYIIKEWDFRELTLKMIPPVFIPRPETEELVDFVIKRIKDLCSESKSVSSTKSQSSESDSSTTSESSGSSTKSHSSSSDSSTSHLSSSDSSTSHSSSSDSSTSHSSSSDSSKSQRSKLDSKLREVNVLEVGCGSGAITLSLLHELPKLNVVAVDKSPLACKLTQENAVIHGMKPTIILAELTKDGTLQIIKSQKSREPFPDVKFDIIVSNPPYVLRKDIKNLQPEIKLYEDLRALDGGKDGMDVIEPLMILSSKILTKKGSLFMEVDRSHPKVIKKWIEDHSKYNLKLKNVLKDISDKDRFVHIVKR